MSEDADDFPPHEDTLSIEQLRREVREMWDLRHDVVKALRDLPEVPPYSVLLLLNDASQWPQDWNQGNKMQRQYGLEKIAPKTEAECGAGLWYRIRSGLMNPVG